MLETLLTRKQGALLKRWKRLVFETYPEEAARFLKTEKDRFNNPVGRGVAHGAEVLLGGLLSQSGLHEEKEKIRTALDEIIRIRSVQDFTPSQAVAFVFLVKKAVREEFGDEIEKEGLYGEFLQFGDRVDELALLAFETYMHCREDLFALKAEALKRGPFRVHDRAARILERDRKGGNAK